MGLLDLFGGGNSGALYGDSLSEDQRAALSQRGLLGFLKGLNDSGALSYTVPFLSGKVPGGFAAGLAGGLGGMGEAQDSAALNAIKIALGGKEIASKDIANQLSGLTLQGWKNAMGGQGGTAPTAPSADAPSAPTVADAAPADTVERPAPTMAANDIGARGEYGAGQSGWPIPMLRTNNEFPALPPNSTNATASGPGWTPGSAPITPASYDPTRQPLGRVPGLLAQAAGNASAAPTGGLLAQAAGQPQPASPMPAPAAAPLLPTRRGVPPMPVVQAQAAPGAAQPLISPQALVDRYNRFNFPGGEAVANQSLQALMKMAPEGFQLMPDGSARLMPGIAAGKGAIKGAEQNAANASDLQYKPQIEGRTEAAKNPALIARTQAEQDAIRRRELAVAGNAADIDTNPYRFNYGPQGAQKGPGYTEPYQTAEGSLVPPVNQAAPIVGSKDSLKGDQANWNKTTEAWAKSRPEIEQGMQRTQDIADALKQVYTGRYTEDLAGFRAKMRAIGVDIPALPDPGQVERILKDNFAASVSLMKSSGLSRWTQAELFSAMKNFANPDLQPEANLRILGQATGALDWERKMITDFGKAKDLGWRDPNDYQSKWMALNPIQASVDRWTDKLAQGMQGITRPSGAAAPQTAAPQSGGTAPEGAIVTGPNGHRLQNKGDYWLDLQTLKPYSAVPSVPIR
jgi:hypothetical protein